jgi:REP element-mobilizing transposase RayT
MERYWLLTNTTYGTWLPGDSRGFVGRVWDRRPEDETLEVRTTHNHVNSEYDVDIPGLAAASEKLMKGSPIYLTLPQAEELVEQFLETARFRHWQIEAMAIMANHFHLVVGVSGDPEPSKILADFKSWGSRRLTTKFGRPASDTWWTARGSKRKLPDESAVRNATRYVLESQFQPLVIWPTNPQSDSPASVRT